LLITMEFIGGLMVRSVFYASSVANSSYWNIYEGSKCRGLWYSWHWQAGNRTKAYISIPRWQHIMLLNDQFVSSLLSLNNETHFQFPQVSMHTSGGFCLVNNTCLKLECPFFTTDNMKIKLNISLFLLTYFL